MSAARPMGRRHRPPLKIGRDDDTYRDAVPGIEARKRHKAKRPTQAKRLYMLRGLVDCSCGARVRGDTRCSRAREWRYCACPIAERKSAQLTDEGMLVECHAKRVPADAAERDVLAAAARLALPDEGVTAAIAAVPEPTIVRYH